MEKNNQPHLGKSGEIWVYGQFFFSPIWANLGLGPKKIAVALFRGHLLFILGKN